MTLLDAYVAAFAARSEAMAEPDQPAVDEPGLRGLCGPGRTRLLVTDDRAHATLAALLPDISGGTVKVLGRAERCLALLEEEPAWRPTKLTAMVCPDLSHVPAPPLPAGLTFGPVRRRDDDPAGVPLEAAVAAVIRADPAIEESRETLTGYVGALPPAFRLFAAVDEEGTVRATSGAAAFGPSADVLFVNTDWAWRRLGIARAMTARALRAAREAGATRACLDASPAGTSVYERLGFVAVSPVTQFFRGD